jgi:hypothetical protein
MWSLGRWGVNSETDLERSVSCFWDKTVFEGPPLRGVTQGVQGSGRQESDGWTVSLTLGGVSDSLAGVAGDWLTSHLHIRPSEARSGSALSNGSFDSLLAGRCYNLQLFTSKAH